MFLDFTYLGEWPLFLFLILLGLALGSFLNSWIWRVWTNMKITNARSICPHCAQQLNWYENIPVFSYFYLRCKCRTCSKPIPWHYTMIEFLTPILILFIAYYRLVYSPGEYYLFARDIFFLSVLIVIFVFDFLYETVLIGLVWIGTAVGFLVNYFLLGHSATSMLYGALVGGGFFLLQFLISRGKWVGGGDMHIGAMMGIWLGLSKVLVALFFSYILGLIVAIILLSIKKKGLKSRIPFGTFLAVGTFIAIYWGQFFVDFYIGRMMMF